MVRAESSQSISFSLPLSWSLMVRWCAARMRKTPRMIMNTRKLTHTTMTMVAALGTTAMEQKPACQPGMVTSASFRRFPFEFHRNSTPNLVSMAS